MELEVWWWPRTIPVFFRFEAVHNLQLSRRTAFPVYHSQGASLSQTTRHWCISIPEPSTIWTICITSTSGSFERMMREIVKIKSKMRHLSNLLTPSPLFQSAPYSSNNALVSLEAPGPRTQVLRMASNPLVCHCSLQWLQDSLNNRGAGKLEIQEQKTTSGINEFWNMTFIKYPAPTNFLSSFGIQEVLGWHYLNIFLCHWKLFSGFKLNCWVPPVGASGRARCWVWGRGPENSPALLAALVLAHPPASVRALSHGGDGSQHLLGLQVRPEHRNIILPLTVCRQLFDQIVFWSPTWNWYRVRNWIMIFGPATKRGHLRSLDRHFTFDPGTRIDTFQMAPTLSRLKIPSSGKYLFIWKFIYYPPISCINWIENSADGWHYIISPVI